MQIDNSVIIAIGKKTSKILAKNSREKRDGIINKKLLYFLGE